MKIVLTGATGFVGSQVLSQLVAWPGITGITCLSRRDFPVQSSKVTIVLQEDFTAYDKTLLHSLADHSACIWTLGGKASDLGTPDVFARITYTFTLAFAQAMALHARNRFSFCYLSGMGADPSETARLPWEKLTRHLKGRVEKDLGLLQARYPMFSAHCFRPGGILPAGANKLLRRLLAPIVVGADELADAMISVAADPNLFRRSETVSNSQIKAFARQVHS